MTYPSAIIFDLDGTLVHSAPDLHAAVNTVLDEIGRAPLDLPRVTGFVGNGAEVLMQRVLDATGDASAEALADAMPRLLRAYAAQGTKLTRPYPGVEATLAALGARGIPLGVCTNKPHDMAVQVCAELGLDRHMDVILGAGPGLPKKPAPDMLHATVERLAGATTGAFYVGDSEVDFATARNAGVDFLLFEGGYLHNPLCDLGPEARFAAWSDTALLDVWRGLQPT